MTNTEQGPDGPSDRRRRPPTTLDLSATEVGDTGPGQAESAEPGRARDAEAAAASQTTPGARPKSVRWPFLLAGGLAGGVIVLLAAGLVWRAGWVGNDARVNELSARLAALDLQLRELQRAQQASANSKASDEIAARLSKLEAAVATPRTSAPDPALASRIAAVETATKAAAEAVAGLTRRTENVATGLSKIAERVEAATQAATAAPRERAEASPETKTDRAELARLAARIGATESGIKSLTEQLGAWAATTEAGLKSLSEQLAKRAAPIDSAARLAVLAITLRDAVERGIPFAAGLVALKPLVADHQSLSPLEPFAASGVPTVAALAREFAAVVPAMQAAVGRPPQDGFLERLQSNAERLVRVRPVSETPGDQPPAVISRAELKVVQGDLPAAVVELEKLPPPARAPAEAWIRKVQARNAAVAAAQRLSSGALAAIASAQGAAER